MVSNRFHQFLAELMSPKDWIAIAVAVLALATSVWSSSATRAFNRLTARPHLHIQEYFAVSSSRLGLVLANVGPGIGIVDEFNFSLDGKRLSGAWREQAKQFQTATGIENWTNVGGYQSGESVAANSSGPVEIILIVDETKFNRDKDPVKWAQMSASLKEVLKRLTVTIKYHSVYGEYFEIEKTGLDAPRFRRRNWFGQFVKWQP